MNLSAAWREGTLREFAEKRSSIRAATQEYTDTEEQIDEQE
jgi:hypothetical protein